MSDNKILVTRSSLPPFNEYVDMIKSIWDNHWLTNMGPLHQQLEHDLKRVLDATNISLFTNGHMALELTLQALNLNGEVITTPFTFASTTHAIVRSGLTPVFCDINPDDYTIDVNKIENLITSKTCAILPVHVYGNICDVNEIERIANKYNLKVIYDAAHAFGAKYDGISSANFGDASMFSFHATKVFNTIEGGAVSFKDQILIEKLNRLKNFGIKDAETVDVIGANAKLSEFHAAMGLCNLKYLDKMIQGRKKVVEQYTSLLSNIRGLKIQKDNDKVDSNYAYYPVLINPIEFGINRDKLAEILEENNIFARKYFYPITSNFKCYVEGINSDTPIAEWVSNNIICLPLYDGLEENQVEYICNVILNAQRKRLI